MQQVEHEWLVEIRILQGMYGAADIWVPFEGSIASVQAGQLRTPIRLVIMVDGETHFSADHPAPGSHWRSSRELTRTSMTDAGC